MRPTTESTREATHRLQGPSRRPGPLHRAAIARLVVGALASLVAAGHAGAIPVFIPLGAGNIVQDISGDGSTVVGYTGAGSARRAWRWTADAGREILRTDGGETLWSEANAVSHDGAVVVGSRAVIPGSTATHAFRWTAPEGMVSLGDLPGGFTTAAAYGVSDDGSVVVGGGTLPPGEGGPTAFRWSGGTMAPLNDFTRAAFDVSGDGSTSVGRALSDGSFLGFVANGTAVTGTLGHLGQMPQNAVANAISADGSTIVGSGIDASGEQLAWRSTGAGGVESIGKLPLGNLGSYATDVSGDGSVIVGGSQSQAFVLDETRGMYSLLGLLWLEDVVSEGDYLFDWQLTEAVAVSDDGTVVVGRGVNPAGNPESWLVDLAVPQSVYLNWDDPISADIRIIDDPANDRQYATTFRDSGDREPALVLPDSITDPEGGATLTANEYRDFVRAAVQADFSNAGINIAILDSRLDEKPALGALEVRFTGEKYTLEDSTGQTGRLGGLAWDIDPFGGGYVDQFNKRLDGEVAVLLDVDGLHADFSRAAGHISHEIGHALGLVHLCADEHCRDHIMDYGHGGQDAFLDDVSQRTDPPEPTIEPTAGQTQNAVYHLQTYASDLDNPDREASTASPGTLDTGEVEIRAIGGEFIDYAGMLANLSVTGVSGSNGFEGRGFGIASRSLFDPASAGDLGFHVYEGSRFRISATSVPPAGGGEGDEDTGEGLGGEGELILEGDDPEGEGGGDPPPAAAIPDAWDLYFGTGDAANPNLVFDVDALLGQLAGSIFQYQADGSFVEVGSFAFGVNDAITLRGEPPPATAPGVVAEPATLSLLACALGLLGLAPLRRRA